MPPVELGRRSQRRRRARAAKPVLGFEVGDAREADLDVQDVLGDLGDVRQCAVLADDMAALDAIVRGMVDDVVVPFGSCACGGRL